MKNKFLVFLIFALFNSAITEAKNDTVTVAELFLKDLSVKKVDYETIIKTHLCLPNVERAEPETEGLTLQLKYLRKMILGNGWSIKNYDSLKPSEQTVQINDDQKGNVFQVKSGTKFVCFILVENGKIASFSTLNKSGKRVFIKNCDN